MEAIVKDPLLIAAVIVGVFCVLRCLWGEHWAMAAAILLAATGSIILAGLELSGLAHWNAAIGSAAFAGALLLGRPEGFARILTALALALLGVALGAMVSPDAGMLRLGSGALIAAGAGFGLGGAAWGGGFALLGFVAGLGSTGGADPFALAAAAIVALVLSALPTRLSQAMTMVCTAMAAGILVLVFNVLNSGVRP